MGSLYLGGPTIQEVDGEMMMGLSIYGVAVINGSLYSRFYGIRPTILCRRSNDQLHTVLYCTTAQSRICLCFDIIHGCGPPWNQNATHTHKYISLKK